MKVTLSDIVNFNNSIQSFLSKKIPLQGAFKLNQIIKSTSDSYSFYTEKLNEIIMKYSEKDEQNIPKFDESGQNILIQKDCFLNMSIEYAYSILRDLQIPENEIKNVYTQLISQNER